MQAAIEHTGKNIIVEDISSSLPRNKDRARWSPRAASEIRSVTVHHTGGSTKLEGIAAPIATAAFCSREEDPDRPGLQGRGWPGIPYAFFIPFKPDLRDNKLVVYRCLTDEENAYQAGIWNRESNSVAFQGTFCSAHHPRGGEPSALQGIVWRELCHYLADRYNLSPFEFWAHAWRGKPSCPGDMIVDWLIGWRDSVNDKFSNDDERELFALVLNLEVPTEEQDPSGLELKNIIKRFQETQIVIDSIGREHPALICDGIYGPATESMLRRVVRSQGML